MKMEILTSSYRIIIIFMWLMYESYSLPYFCPHYTQWRLRTKGFCENEPPSYTCLWDANQKAYVEQCEEEPVIQQPGYKLVIRGGYDGEKCGDNRYQPRAFLTNENNECIYRKSLCEEEGQRMISNGSTTNDVGCVCDYTGSYAFIQKPRNPCSCIPSAEDCSCYLKNCPEGYRLSPDYICIKGQVENNTCSRICKTSENKYSTCPIVNHEKNLGVSYDLALTKDNPVDSVVYCLLIITILCIACILIYLVQKALCVKDNSLSNLKDPNTITETVSCDLDEKYKQKYDHPAQYVATLIPNLLEDIRDEQEELTALICLLFVLYNNEITEKLLCEDPGLIAMISNVANELNITRCFSNAAIVEELTMLSRFYIERRETFYTIHKDNYWKALLSSCKGGIVDVIISLATPEAIRDNFIFESLEVNQHQILVPTDREFCYFKRLCHDLDNGDTESVFRNNQMKYSRFRERFMEHLSQREETLKTLLLYSNTEHSPLLLASEQGYADISLTLVNLGFYIDVKNKEGTTPLINASKIGNERFVELLLEKEADCNLSNNCSETPLYIASWNGNQEVVFALLQKYQCIYINKCTCENKTPLYAAVSAGHTEIVKKILQNRANPDKACKRMITPLYLAVDNENDQIVGLLLQYKANANICTATGKSPLHIAAEKGLFEISKKLLQHNAKITSTDNWGNTPLSLASEHGHSNIVQLFSDND